MSINYSNRVRTVLEEFFRVTDDLDASGISSNFPLVDETEGLRGAIRTDMILFMFRIMDSSRRITDVNVDFLNESFEFNFTKLTAEVARKKALETNVSDVGYLLPYFILVDNKLGKPITSNLYLLALSGVLWAFLSSMEDFIIDEWISYSRYLVTCKELVEKTLNKEIPFDPYGFFTEKYKDIMKCAVDVDREINNSDKDESIISLEKMLTSIVSG